MALEQLLDEARDLQSEAVALRRRLHRHPEIGNENPHTRDELLAAIEGLPLDITSHRTTTGVAALLTGDRPGPTILLRADTDGLPLHEDTDLDFTSATEGHMHACGHDTHVAMLVSAAKMLSARKGNLAGRVLFMFQPGEEGHHGARFMLEEGLLDIPSLADGTASPVTAAFALHIMTTLPTGYFAVKGGSIMASADRMYITVKGRGGHASEPYRALDPIPIACEIVQALQMMVTRRIDVFDPGVITVGRITAGTTNNIIPESAEIEGTIRAVSESTRKKLFAGIQRVAEGIGAAHEAEVTVNLIGGFPVTVNDVEFADTALGAARELVGNDRGVRMPNPVMGAEDFSYVLQRVPGSMMFLGATHPDRDLRTAAPNHSNLVHFDEDAMVHGAAMHTLMACRHLGLDET